MQKAERTFRMALLLLFFLCFSLTSLFSDTRENDLFLEALQPDRIVLRPLETKTWTFRVTNGTRNSLDLETEGLIPSGWNGITPPASFSLAPGANSIRMFAVGLPLDVKAGEYRLRFRVKSPSSGLLRESELIVHVPLITDIKVERIELPSMVVGGDAYEARYRIINLSNAPTVVTLRCQSDNNIPVFAKDEEILLAPGESKPVSLHVETPADIRWNIRHRLKLTAAAVNSGGEEVSDSVLSFVNVIPAVSGEDHVYHRLPVEISLVGLRGSAQILQAAISGGGTLRDDGSARVEFMVRGPRQETLQQFGYSHESLKLAYLSPQMEIGFGDRVFSLTKLTEYGIYGRGIRGEIRIKRFSLSAFGHRSYFQDPDIDQRAVRLSYTPASGKTGFSINYLENRVESSTMSQIMSLSARLSLSSLFRSRLEFARGNGSREGRQTGTGQAFWLEANGNWKRSGYRISFLRSSRDFPGHYRNLRFLSSSMSLGLWKGFAFKASYHELERQPDGQTDAGKERSYQIGINLALSKKLNMSLDYRARDRRLPLGSAPVDYSDRMIRLGINPKLRNFNINAALDIGETHNRIGHTKESLFEAGVSGTATLFKRLALTGSFQARNQMDRFTGDYERGNNITLNATLDLNRTQLSAYYRSAIYREFYERIIFDSDMVQEMLFSQMTFFEVSLQHQLKNRHVLGFRLRKAANPSERDGGSHMVALVEYKIPLGIPVSRLSDRGSLTGRVAGPAKTGIAGAVVELNQMSTLTDRDGRFYFYSVKPGDYLLKIKYGSLPKGMISLKPLPVKVRIDAKKRSQLEIPVIQSASIQGQVIQYREERRGLQIIQEREDEDIKLTRDKVLRGIVIEVKSASGGVYYGQTDKRGRFFFEGLKPGDWEIRAYAKKMPELHVFEQDMFSLTLGEGESRELIFKVIPKKRRVRIIQTGHIGSSDQTGSDNDNNPLRKEENNNARRILIDTPLPAPRIIGLGIMEKDEDRSIAPVKLLPPGMASRGPELGYHPPLQLSGHGKFEEFFTEQGILPIGLTDKRSGAGPEMILPMRFTYIPGFFPYRKKWIKGQFT
jgi:hypothetical protein